MPHGLCANCVWWLSDEISPLEVNEEIGLLLAQNIEHV